jgi:hypothetical protein
VLPFPPPYPPAAGHAPERRQDGGLDLYWKAGSMAKVPARPPTPYDYRPRIWPSGCTQGAQPPQTPFRARSSAGSPQQGSGGRGRDNRERARRRRPAECEHGPVGDRHGFSVMGPSTAKE